MNDTPFQIVIVGGGIAGLACAYHLEQLATTHRTTLEIRLFESQRRLGGVIRSERHGDFLVEAGPDSFLTVKPWALELARDLGLEPRLVSTQEAFRQTYVARGSQLHPLPAGFILLAPTALWPLFKSPLFTWPGKIRMACELLLPRGPQNPDESLASFVIRRFGREALDRVAQPLVGGIYLAKADELSLAATMPRFLEMERQHRSVILAMRRQPAPPRPGQSGARWNLFVSFDTGLELLVETLARRLRRTQIALGRPVSAVKRGQRWGIALDDGKHIWADAVVVATPAPAAAQLLRNVSAPLSSELATVETTPSLTVSLAFRSEQVGRLPNTFGIVVPRTEGKHLWACTISSRKYPNRAPHNSMLLRAFYGGIDQQHLLEKDDEELVRLALAEIGTWIPFQGKPLFHVVRRYPIGLPLYRVGHLAKVQRIQSLLEPESGLAVAGNSYEGVGIPDCIRSGYQAAEKIWKDLRLPTAGMLVEHVPAVARS